MALPSVKAKAASFRRANGYRPNRDQLAVSVPKTQDILKALDAEAAKVQQLEQQVRDLQRRLNSLERIVSQS